MSKPWQYDEAIEREIAKYDKGKPVMMAERYVRYLSGALAAAREALEEAGEAIHSEYCSSTHHPECDKVRAALGK